MNEQDREQERRRNLRDETHRAALFCAPEGANELRDGVAVDAGAGGLRIETHTPEAPGLAVEVELAARREGDPPVQMHGRVAYVEDLGDGLHAMGIQVAAPAVAAGALPAEYASPTPPEDAPGPAAPPPTPAPAEAPAPEKKRRRWLLVALLLFLLLFPAAVLLVWLGGQGVFTRAEEARAAAPAAVLPVEAGGTFVDSYPGVDAALAGWLADWEAAQAAYWREGMRPALDMLEQAMLMHGPLPDAWRKAAREMRAGLLTGEDQVVRSALSVPAFEISDLPETEAEEDEEGTRLEVDTRHYVLTVYENGVAKAAFPVGLGADDATPKGTFRIANKIETPDWYRRGERVPAGSGRNQIGRFWMGLGGPDGAMSYGFHPTQDLDAIGAGRSRGCIRMRPRDAARLFALCSIGDPVIIR